MAAYLGVVLQALLVVMRQPEGFESPNRVTPVLVDYGDALANLFCQFPDDMVCVQGQQ